MTKNDDSRNIRKKTPHGFPQLRLILPRRRHFPANPGIQRHTIPRLFYGNRTKHHNPLPRNRVNRFRRNILPIHLPKTNETNKIAKSYKIFQQIQINEAFNYFLQIFYRAIKRILLLTNISLNTLLNVFHAHFQFCINQDFLFAVFNRICRLYA